MLWLLAFFLGSLVVFQPTINRLVLEQRGLSFAVLVNSLVLFFLASCLIIVTYLSPQNLPEIMHYRSTTPFRPWFILPGVMGFLLVMFVPIMIRHYGAFKTVLVMLAGQITTSFVYDLFVEGRALHSSRVLGIICALLAVFFSFRPTH